MTTTKQSIPTRQSNYDQFIAELTRITRQYGVQGLPITYFIDREGRIGGKILGEADQKLLMSQLKRILPDAR